jgi:hypothetical protein
MNAHSRYHFMAIPARAATVRSRSGGLPLCAPGVVSLACATPFDIAAGILPEGLGDNDL